MCAAAGHFGSASLAYGRPRGKCRVNVELMAEIGVSIKM